MQVRKVLTSLTFRYIVKYVTVLSVSVFLFLAAIYGYFSYSHFRELSGSIVDETDSLRMIFSGQGLPGAMEYIDDQQRSLSMGRFHYLLTDGSDSKLAGDLPPTPRYIEFDEGWLGFEIALQDWGEEREVDFLARAVDLGDGYRVLVARDYADAVERGRLVFRTLSGAMLVTILLGITAGFFSASSTLQRIDRLHRELSEVIRSDPGQRLDLTEEKGYVRELALVMNEMLQQTETLMQGVRRVSDNIAHDLRTPLTRLRNHLSQLQAQASGDTAEEIAGTIAECDALLASFNAVLRISTLETGSRLAGGAEVDLGQLLQDVVELYEPLAQEKQLSLHTELVTGCCSRGEADLLFQMFANLLDNAIKYTPEGGRVTVSLTPAAVIDRLHRVSFADTGPGIPHEQRDAVFRRFYRLEESRSGLPGHGLGLSLVQAIARYHHGSVSLKENRPGLRVEVALPVAGSAAV